MQNVEKQYVSITKRQYESKHAVINYSKCQNGIWQQLLQRALNLLST